MQRGLEEQSHAHVSWKNLKSNHTSMGPVNEAKLTSSDGVKVGWGRMFCGGVSRYLGGVKGCMGGVGGCFGKGNREEAGERYT